jgi:hypothetical protein
LSKFPYRVPTFTPNQFFKPHNRVPTNFANF